MKLTVIGAGAWGTTLAALASEHLPTTLWAREPAVVNAIHDRRENTLFLPGFPLPGQLSVTRSPDAVAGADFVVVAVPSPHVRAVLAMLVDGSPRTLWWSASPKASKLGLGGG